MLKRNYKRLLFVGIILAGWPFIIDPTTLSCILSPQSCHEAQIPIIVALGISSVSILIGSCLLTWYKFKPKNHSWRTLASYAPMAIVLAFGMSAACYLVMFIREVQF